MCDRCHCYKCILRTDLRKAFSEHVIYTYNYITMYSSQEAPSTLDRLLKTSIDISKVLEEYIGEGNANTLMTILIEHIKLAGGAIEATYEGRCVNINGINDNARKLAYFLASLNNKYIVKDLIEEFVHHSMFIVQLVKARLDELWEKEISLLDSYYQHMLKFSDMIVEPF
jgi:Lhr-like helicase